VEENNIHYTHNTHNELNDILQCGCDFICIEDNDSSPSTSLSHDLRSDKFISDDIIESLFNSTDVNKSTELELNE